MNVLVDSRQFDAALKQYLKLTSRDVSTALNGKSKDLCLRAAQNTPKSKMTHAQFVKQQTSPEFVGAVAREIYKRRGGIGGNASFGQIYRATKATMAAKKFQRGYMRSAFVKAANQYRDTKDASKERPQKLEAVYNNTRAEVKRSSPQKMEAESFMKWAAKNARDSSEKQAMVSAGLAAAIPVVTADMVKYIEKKLGNNAKQVSAK